MSVPPPPPLPPPIYYPQTSTIQPSSNGNSTVEEGRCIPGQQATTMQSPLEMLCLSVVHNLTQICLGGVVISALIIPNILGIQFRSLMQHTVLCTVGYFIVMAQGILTYSPVGWANTLKYENQKLIHSTMQIIGSVLAIAGSAVQIAETNFALGTSHGLCGLVATILTIINLLAGIFNCFYNQKRKNKLLKILHLCLGTFTISLAFITLILAFHFYYREVAGDNNANFAIALTVFALVGTLLMALLKNARGILQS